MPNKKTDLVPAATRSKIQEYFTRGLQNDQAEETEELRGMFGGVAMSRYREGLTDDGQLLEELRLLGYPEGQLPQYLAAGRLNYALDYFRDLLSAWRDAVRAGNISLETYAGKLAELGLVPERVASYILREVARIKPGQELTLEPVPAALYETDAGRIAVDTVRRRRRKNIITREEELTDLLALGMPIDLASAMTANDDIRNTGKAEGD